MKKNIIRTIKCIVFLVVVAAGLLVMTDVMTCNDLVSQLTIEGLNLEEKNTMDTLVIGASEVFSGYSPIKVWDEYGITSYSLGLSGAGCKVYEPLLKEAMRRQKPKAVVFELNGFIHKDDYSEKIGKLKNVYDNLSWSGNRLSAIHKNVPKEERFNFYVPLMTYHSLWSSPNRVKKHLKNRGYLKKAGTTYLKGTSTYSYAYDMKELKKEKVIFTEQEEQYLRDLLDYCQSQNIEHVLFYRSPIGSEFKNKEEMQRIFDIVESYGYDTVDLTGAKMEELGIDIHHDFYNRDHMNVYGMEKLSHYMGEYFSKDCGIKGEHDQKVVDNWNEWSKKANEMFEDCKKNIGKKKVAHYFESTFYEGVSFYSNPAAALNISKKNFK